MFTPEGNRGGNIRMGDRGGVITLIDYVDDICLLVLLLLINSVSKKKKKEKKYCYLSKRKKLSSKCN